MSYVLEALGIANAIVLFGTLIPLIRSSLRRYAIVAAYILWETVANVALTTFDIITHGSSHSVGAVSEAQRLYGKAYWTNDIIVDLFRFVLVIVLIYRMAGQSNRVRRILSTIVLAAILLPFVIFQPNFRPWPSSVWFNSTSELLNFGAALMNLVLWGTLLASKRRDPLLIRVSIGLGIVVTGSALAYGMRHFIPAGGWRSAPNLFLMLTQLAGWLIWFYAFWREPAPAARSITVQTAPSH